MTSQRNCFFKLKRQICPKIEMLTASKTRIATSAIPAITEAICQLLGETNEYLIFETENKNTKVTESDQLAIIMPLTDSCNLQRACTKKWMLHYARTTTQNTGKIIGTSLFI